MSTGSETLTVEEAVAELARIAVEYRFDNEVAHDRADKVLLAVVPAEVREAWEQTGEAVGEFWYS